MSIESHENSKGKEDEHDKGRNMQDEHGGISPGPSSIWGRVVVDPAHGGRLTARRLVSIFELFGLRSAQTSCG